METKPPEYFESGELPPMSETMSRSPKGGDEQLRKKIAAIAEKARQKKREQSAEQARRRSQE